MGCFHVLTMKTSELKVQERDAFSQSSGTFEELKKKDQLLFKDREEKVQKDSG